MPFLSVLMVISFNAAQILKYLDVSRLNLTNLNKAAREAITMHSRIGTLGYKLCVLNCYLLLVWDLLLVHIFTDDTMSLSRS